MSTTHNPGPLGQRLKSLRSENSWTLAYVAEKTGISRSTLSKLENGQTNMSFTSVNKLAQGLGLPISALTTPHGKLSTRRSLTRLGGGTQFLANDAHYEVLCSELSNQDHAYLKITVKSRQLDDTAAWRKHPGQEFLYVLSGTLILHTSAYDPTELKAGDSIVFDSSMDHKYYSKGPADAEVLVTMQLDGYTDIEDTLEEILQRGPSCSGP